MPLQFEPASPPPPGSLWRAFRLRWKRRRFLARIWRKRREIVARVDRTRTIRPGAILCFVTLRNESLRLPQFLAYYRKLGVDHFLVVDNSSTDGTTTYLAGQPDLSLWTTQHSYRAARFGMDWLGWLQIVHAPGHWALTVDADELLVFARHDAGGLRALTAELEEQGREAFGALLLDLYPEGALGDATYRADDNPLETLTHFDAGPYHAVHHPLYENLYIQGGVRERVFFAADPARAPTLNKVPLVRWNRRFAYVSSTHQMLPPRLNRVFGVGGNLATGVLLHTKFLPEIAARAAEEMERREHFENSALYDDYYRALIENPVLWHTGSVRYTGWQQMVELGLMADPDGAQW